MRNDHVLAIVKLKEEELERQEQAKICLKSLTGCKKTEKKDLNNDNEDIDKDDLPKLTRSKAKELNQFPLPVAPIKHSEPDEHIVALVQGDWHSDDEDEEYQPGEDDIEVILFSIY